MAHVTIRDLARHAQVSIATVSRVLNNQPNVSETARRQVLAAAEALGYVPNSIARSLVKRATQTLGLVVSDITNPFFPAVARGVEDRASEAGYTVILCNTDRRPDKEASAAAVLMAKQVDGIIFAASRASSRYLHDMVRSTPVVTFEPALEHARVGRIAFDNVAAARLATRHLLSLGHTRIGLIGNDLTTMGGLDRLKGYQLALAEWGLPVERALICEGHFDWESGYEGARRLLQMGDPPTALQACSDISALGAIEGVESLGLRVPQDVSVIGFDDIPLARATRPRLTTIRQPAYAMGAAAVEILLALIAALAQSDPTAAPERQRQFAPELVVRESTAAPPSA